MTNRCSDVEELGLLLDDVRRAEHHLARAVIRAGRLASSGVSEAVEGLPLDLLLGVACRLTGADRRMLIAAGETLADLPAVSTLFTEGGLSWGQVRAITTAAKRLSADARAVLDARVAASAAGAADPDDLVWAVQAAADGLRAPARWSGRRCAAASPASCRCKRRWMVVCGCTASSTRSPPRRS